MADHQVGHEPFDERSRTPMYYSVQRAMAWSGVAVGVLTMAGFLLARFLPVPPGAYLSAQQIAEFYGAHPTNTRVGLMLISVGLSFLGPMVALISTQMLRIRDAPASLAHLQQIGGIGVIVVTVLPAIIMNAAAFRTDRDPVAIQAINDVGWLLFITAIGLFWCQEVPIGVAILMDRSAKPVFPRWVGYVNLWVPLSFLPALLAYFFTTGPFSWQGILVFYLGLGTFGLWAGVMIWALLRAVGDEEANAKAGFTAGSGA